MKYCNDPGLTLLINLSEQLNQENDSLKSYNIKKSEDLVNITNYKF